MNRRWSDHGGNDGFALLVVILVMLITSFLASQLILQVRTDLRIATNMQDRLVGRMLAEGGINLALFRIVDVPGMGFEEKVDGATFLGGMVYETVLPTGKMEYYAVSESGKIDLNSANDDLLKKFLTYYGLAEEEVEIVIDSLLDWRDDDDLYRINGAEAEYYEGVGLSYLPRNGKIEDPAEFFLIRGTESLKGLFDPYDVFTVNNPGGKLNINNLSPVMLAFLVGNDENLIEQFREEQKLAAPNRLSKAKLQEIAESEIYNTLGVYLDDSANVSKIYSIVGRGFVGDFSLTESGIQANNTLPDQEEDKPVNRRSTKVSVLIDFSQKEYKYLSWREQYI